MQKNIGMYCITVSQNNSKHAMEHTCVNENLEHVLNTFEFNFQIKNLIFWYISICFVKELSFSP
jgi:hypothetical protein